MHSPETIAFEIGIPWPKKKYDLFPTTDQKRWKKIPVITIWHVDPEKDGTDDSCGWFMRCRHGDKEMYSKIRSALDFEFDREFTSSERTYYTGWFSPGSGTPNFSTMGITLNMFSLAAWQFFKYNRKKHRKWMNKNLYDILHFAENTVDSLRDEIEGTFRSDMKWDRNEKLDHYTSIIYAWIMRSTRPWYKHPRWHIHHWEIQFHPWQNLKRRYWDKCCVCGKRGFKGSACSDWNGTKMWHHECSNPKEPTPTPKEEAQQ